MHALIIREPWISLILSGAKDWEMRTTPAPRLGRIGLIRKGTGMIVGTAEIAASLRPLDAAGLAASRGHHRIPVDMDVEVLQAGWLHPWVLREVRALPQPIAAGQKPGQVIWVPLSTDVTAAVERQFEAATALFRVGAAACLSTSRRLQSRASADCASKSPGPSLQPSRRNTEEVTFELTRGAIANGNLSVRQALHLLPEGVVGGENRSMAASKTVTIVFEPGQTIQADVAGDKMLLRCRGAVSDFYARSGAMPGDSLLLSRVGSDALHVQLVRKNAG